MSCDTIFSQVTIVIVEDHSDTRVLLTDFLTQLGARVVQAGDAKEGLEAIDRCSPNVVLSDIWLPIRSGFELLRDIRNLASANRHVPVVAMTALGGIVEQEKAIAAGFHGLLRKPFSPDQLLDLLQSALH
jgi:CheY-like chemotaxis protein